uniref:Uncharacterized protein n=1 Tax=Mesocestoides corti TaxID=53468 RepID=A0A5K3EFW6_MESCO
MTEQALLTNHKPEPHVRRLPSESTTLATPIIIYCSSLVSFSGWLPIILACHWNAGAQDWLKPGGPKCLRPIPTPLAPRQAPSIRVHHVGHAAHYILHLIHVLLWLAAYLPRMPLERTERRDWLMQQLRRIRAHTYLDHTVLSQSAVCLRSNGMRGR